MAKALAIAITLLSIAVWSSTDVLADERIKLKTTTIKGNKELPKILYVVPWKDIKRSKLDKQQLVLHSLFGDLFEPVLPRQVQKKQ
jgi:hypothetical protein